MFRGCQCQPALGQGDVNEGKGSDSASARERLLWPHALLKQSYLKGGSDRNGGGIILIIIWKSAHDW